jgi:chromosome segregation ATPase
VSDESRRRDQVHLNVYGGEKEKWRKTVRNDPNVESLSQLVRVAVTQYIQTRRGDGGPRLNSIREDIESLSRRLQSLEGQLEGLQSSLDELSEDSEPLEWTEPSDELTAEVFEALPTVSEVQSGGAVDGSESRLRGSKQWLFDRIEAPNGHIVAAIERLEATTHMVRQTPDGQYFKEA